MSDDAASTSVPARSGGRVHNACAAADEGGKAGKSRVEIALDLDLSLPALNALEARHPTLKTALAKARDHELAWWERQAREGVSQGTKFNAALWTRCMAARFPEQSYGDTDNATVAPATDPRDRAKAVAALLSALQAGEPVGAASPSSGGAGATGSNKTRPAGAGRPSFRSPAQTPDPPNEKRGEPACRD